ncbi:MAG: hypothetical protein M1813_007078 [Trichoglossum hirsutum]|nr:MAG: hypothetical protein M1813_007078 [Trichoglossum hirsutum]
MSDEATPPTDTTDIPSLDTVLASLQNVQSEGADFETEDDSGEDTDLKREFGLECGIKNLYEGPPKCRCCTNWVEAYPDDLVDSVGESLDCKRQALVLRNKKSHKGRKPIQVEEIVVQSPLLKKFLDVEIKDYKGVTPTLKDVIFSRPFQAFFHLWDWIQDGVTNHEDEETRSHIRLLLRVLKKELKDTVAMYRDFLSLSVITFEFLWTIFKPGDLVYSPGKTNDPGRIYYLIRSEYKCHPQLGEVFDLKCAYIDWDGSKFGVDTTWKQICLFEGTKPIVELDIYPTHLHNKFEEIREKIMTRGKKFHMLQGCHYKAYDAVACRPAFRSLWCDEREVHVDGRIVIDTEAYFRYNSSHRSSLSDTLPGAQSSTRPISEHYDSDRESNLVQSQYLKHQQRNPMQRTISEDGKLTDEQLLICVNYVRGYSLKVKDWVELDIVEVTDIIWDEDAFPSLILPGQTKEIILSFVETQVSQTVVFDDVIAGKGRGIIILLSGEPGVGKTLTAEAVAEVMRKPLYSITAGELGSSVDEIESRLTRILELAARWKAILLLDEADVFLEQRSTSDLERNKLVSVFLRTLEYYKGVLFITTNRVSAFDEAFKSRIHLSLKYPPLDSAAQVQVWKAFINRSSSQKIEFSDDDMMIIKQYSMNGREIKNVVKMACLLSNKEKTPLGMGHVRKILATLYGDLSDNSSAALPVASVSISQASKEASNVILRNGLLVLVASSLSLILSGIFNRSWAAGKRN